MMVRINKENKNKPKQKKKNEKWSLNSKGSHFPRLWQRGMRLSIDLWLLSGYQHPCCPPVLCVSIQKCLLYISQPPLSCLSTTTPSPSALYKLPKCSRTRLALFIINKWGWFFSTQVSPQFYLPSQTVVVTSNLFLLISAMNSSRYLWTFSLIHNKNFPCNYNAATSVVSFLCHAHTVWIFKIHIFKGILLCPKHML